MMGRRLLARLTALWGDKNASAASQEVADRLRARHRRRCNDFRLLIRANNKALEGMAEIEEVLRGTTPFGMSFVRGHCVRVVSAVRQIVQRINALSENSHTVLDQRLDAISASIESALAPQHATTRKAPPLPRIPHVLPLDEVTNAHADEVGPKALNLCLAARGTGLTTPKGFVATASAYRLFMNHEALRDEVQRLTQIVDTNDLEGLASLSRRIRDSILRTPLPPSLHEALTSACAAIPNDNGALRLAVRSSALGEDLPGLTAAGQYRTLLDVLPENSVSAYREVVASKYDVPALAYRFNRGIRDEDVDMCVAFMPMVNAAAGGVAYSRNPAYISSPRLLVSAVSGSPSAVVDGTRDSALYEAERTTGASDHAPIRLLTNPHGETPLTPEQALAVAAMADTLELFFGCPQDVEWALDTSGALILLQSRPLHGVSEPELPRDQPGGDTALQPFPLHAPARQGLPPPLLHGGITASPGTAHGPAHLLRSSEDAYACPHGAIAVVVQSLPRWAPVMNRVAGLIAERGSATGHLASVAREFGIPALFGVENAVTILANWGQEQRSAPTPGAERKEHRENQQTAQEITVDADNCRVYAGAHVALSGTTAPPRRNLMQGSPVHTALRAAADHILPLTLLDPTADSFRPANCQTLHDITRFCHEKAVEELFREDAALPRERLSRQLYVDRPMQYRVVDLDDGIISPPQLADAPTPRFVQLHEIRSVPMLALWHGMTAVPLEAPVSVDTRGFMSVLAQAASSPELDPAAHSSFTQQNFFMIASSFCNLQARFGFHFSTAEAQLTGVPQENYVTLRFKGGAADLDRRLRRVRLLGELLEKRGFRVDICEDALFGRMEGLPNEETEEGAALVGFCIMHSRQLDMVMGNSAKVAEWRDRLDKGMETVTRTLTEARPLFSAGT